MRERGRGQALPNRRQAPPQGDRKGTPLPDTKIAVLCGLFLLKRRDLVRDILPDVERWRERGERVAVATVVTMYGSAPRRPGAKLAVSESGELSGSVSGGCVEPAVVHSAMEVIETGEPQMLEFGISEEENFEKIGLSCGGTIHVFVERLDW